MRNGSSCFLINYNVDSFDMNLFTFISNTMVLYL